MPYPLFMLTGWACIASGRDGEPSWGWVPAALCCSWDWLPVPLRCNMNWDGSIRLVRDGSVSPNKTSMLASSAPPPPPPPQPFYGPFFRDHPGEPVTEENFWTYGAREDLQRQTHRPSAGSHSIRTNQCPPPPYSYNFYGPDALPAVQPTVSSAVYV